MKTVHELSRAETIDEIVRITREYVVGWSQACAESFFPDEYRPGPVRDLGDIEAWADRLNEATIKARLMPEAERRLDALAAHFLLASVRARLIAAA